MPRCALSFCFAPAAAKSILLFRRVGPLIWPDFLRRKRATLYVHFPCFDGVVSGVLCSLFLESTRGWKFKDLKAVNYQLQQNWLSMRLPHHSAVVDFLYHPQADFWADHHGTTFLTEQLRKAFDAEPKDSRFYDRNSPSCASLLWTKLGASFGEDERLHEMVRWAEKIDSAAYDSSEEALFGTEPALVLSRSLALDADQHYCAFLISTLRRASLREVCASAEVQSRYVRAVDLGRLGLERVKNSIRLEGEVAIYDVNMEGVLIDRYSAYHPDLYAKAKYSIGVSRSEKSIAITAMRNPWLDFESRDLGSFMRQFGGGGHQRVGAIVIPKEQEAEVDRIVQGLLQEVSSSAGVPERVRA